MSESVGVSPGSSGRQPKPITDPDKLRAAELERGQALSETAEARGAAMAEVRARGESGFLPGFMQGIGGALRKNIVSALERGARPVQIKSDSGKTITVGALEKDGTYTGRTDYRDIAREAPGSGTIMTSFAEALKRRPTEERDDPAPSPEPEIQPPSPEEIPEGFEYDAATNELIETATGRRRRFMRRRGGTLAQGGGVLYE